MTAASLLEKTSKVTLPPPFLWSRNMQNAIKAEIKKLAKRAFAKKAKSKKRAEHYQARFSKRTGLPAGESAPQAEEPRDRHFDPAYCARNANFLAKSLWHKVLTLSYEPKPAVCFRIPKGNGQYRKVMAFSIPDAALANVIMRRARKRNLKRLSPFSYAYHPHKDLFDAIIDLQEYGLDDKRFVVQMDFEKYFDSIPTAYLEGRLADERLSITPHEKHVFAQFLRHSFYEKDSDGENRLKRRHKGTPQGASVSSWLANLASHELDLRLSAAPGRFARYADDVLAISSEYSHALQQERCFHEHCKNSGLKINASKSPGIAILSETQAEMRTIPHFDYLGYRFTPHGLTMTDRTMRRLKAKISRLVHLYLIHYLKFGFNPQRCQSANAEGVKEPLLKAFLEKASLPSYDWDLLGLIYELRRSLYGGLTEDEIGSFLRGEARPPKMAGLMGFYCLLEDTTPLKELDGWMLNIVRRAMRVRNRILAKKYGATCPTPSSKTLVTGTWLDKEAWRGEGELPDARMPSLMRGWRAARKFRASFGLEKVDVPEYVSYSSDMADLFDHGEALAGSRSAGTTDLEELLRQLKELEKNEPAYDPEISYLASLDDEAIAEADAVYEAARHDDLEDGSESETRLAEEREDALLASLLRDIKGRSGA